MMVFPATASKLPLLTGDCCTRSGVAECHEHTAASTALLHPASTILFTGVLPFCRHPSTRDLDLRNNNRFGF